MAAKSLSIIIPALNEEGNIRSACQDMSRIAEKYLTDYEILVFDDASNDRTSEVVKELQKGNPHIKLFRNSTNKGLGYNYRVGILNAKCDYTMMVPGDNEVIAESLEEIFKQLGVVDIVICYSTNPGVRPLWRQMISKVFTALLNFLFGLKIRYHNGPSVIRTDLAKEFPSFTNSFAYMAVILVQLLRFGASYKEMSFALRGRESGKTKAFRLENVVNVVKDVMVLFWKVCILRQSGRVFTSDFVAKVQHPVVRS